MNKLANMRHWPERMSPNFGMNRGGGIGLPGLNAHPKAPPQSVGPAPPPLAAPPSPDMPINYSFNMPFASDLAGPDTEDILHATDDAVLRWTHPEDAADDVPVYELPIHAQNLALLRKMCKDITQTHLAIEAHVITTPRSMRGQVVTVCLSGAHELVLRSRETLLNDLPSLRCTTVDVDGQLVADLTEGVLNKSVTGFLNDISSFCGVDIFLLGPKLTPLVDSLNGDGELLRDQRWRVAIYGDQLSTEHAKTRVLIHIDQLLGRIVDAFKFEISLHQMVSGRSRKNVKQIESATNTAIYFPPPWSVAFRYCPPLASRRDLNEILITGDTPGNIEQAKMRLHELLARTRAYCKDVIIPGAKIDSILLSRMDKVRKITEANGTFILFPPLGSGQNTVRIQGFENLYIERTAREMMALVGQFYTGTWWVTQPEGRQMPSPSDVQAMLGDICATSDAEIIFDKFTFSITGSDEAVKAAMMVISQIDFVVSSPYQIRIKIELANEHKEFVSGKKNGKINKIMGQSSVQIMFDNFGEYNFHIDVLATSYDSMKHGLSLVEQEMPASISFHVPDSYHKRIIGIGGQHIQRIMKKHSVFVKFSNAMERGGVGREDEDSRVDNVICRTPARNAHNLELVKSEILELVDHVDSEFLTQIVNVDRLYHRQLLARLAEIEQLEKQWNCKIVFPGTEQASDEVSVTGPEWMVPHCVDSFLGMVPDKHEVVMERTPDLIKFLESPDFVHDMTPKLKAQHEVEVSVLEQPEERTETGGPTVTLLWTFTRNNAGGLRDATDYLLAQLATADVAVTIIKGALQRPKSDTFEESLPFFNSRLLQQAPTTSSTDSPTQPSFGDQVARERSNIFDKLRKPGSMSSISSFLDRRKNSSHSTTAQSLFKGSTNVSKSSLISIESTRSFNADRNPWNDSGVNLSAEDDHAWPSSSLSNPPGTSSSHRAFSGSSGSNGLIVPQSGELTPRHHNRQSHDSGRPSTSNSTHSAYPSSLTGHFR